MMSEAQEWQWWQSTSLITSFMIYTECGKSNTPFFSSFFWDEVTWRKGVAITITRPNTRLFLVGSPERSHLQAQTKNSHNSLWPCTNNHWRLPNSFTNPILLTCLAVSNRTIHWQPLPHTHTHTSWSHSLLAKSTMASFHRGTYWKFLDLTDNIVFRNLVTGIQIWLVARVKNFSALPLTYISISASKVIDFFFFLIY